MLDKCDLFTFQALVKEHWALCCDESIELFNLSKARLVDHDTREEIAGRRAIYSLLFAKLIIDSSLVDPVPFLISSGSDRES